MFNPIKLTIMIITLVSVVAAVGLTLMAITAGTVKQMSGTQKQTNASVKHLQDQLGGLIIALRQLNDDLRSRNGILQKKLDEQFESENKRTAMFSAHLASIEDTLTNLRADGPEKMYNSVLDALRCYAADIEERYADKAAAVENQEMEQMPEQAPKPEPEASTQESPACSKAPTTIEERYRAMKQMKEEGKSLSEIAKAFGMKSKSSVTRFLQRNAKKFEK